ncbi:hypothetical protein JW868_04820 [Candidatus Woesearchaeota archaeon]|nr:hypothetical protein [Candidatus Woesearchaeota archaeon]
MKRGLAILLAILCMLSQANALVEFTEIMYNPEGNDNNQEFVELFILNETFNITELIFGDMNLNDSLEILQSADSNYYLIVEEGYNYSGLNCTILTTGATIGDNLDNSGDTIFIYNNHETLDLMHYDASMANGNGHSLEKQNQTWAESLNAGGSPCLENPVNQTEPVEQNETNQTDNNIQVKVNIILPSFPIVNETYFPFSLNQEINTDYWIQFSYNTTLTDDVLLNISSENELNNASLMFNQTGNICTCTQINECWFKQTNASANYTCMVNENCIESYVRNTTLEDCNISLALLLEEDFIDENTSVHIHNIISDESFDYIINYWVTDFFGNVLSNKTTTNDNPKSYRADRDQPLDILYVHNYLFTPSCNNINTQVANSESVIYVGSPPPNTTHLEVELEDQTYHYGGDLPLTLHITKGDTTKQVIEIKIKAENRIVSTAKVKVPGKNVEMTAELELPLPENCPVRFQEGEAILYIEGLDYNLEYTVNLENEEACEIEECSDAETVVRYCPDENEKFEDSDEAVNQLEELNLNSQEFSNPILELNISVHNKYDTAKNYSINSYIYKNSVSYSGDRQINTQEFSLEPGETKNLILNNTFIGVQGTYKFKIQLLRADRKTPIEITQDLNITEKEISESILNQAIQTPLQNPNGQETSKNELTGLVIQETKSINYLNHLPVLVVALLLGGLYYKKKAGRREKKRNKRKTGPGLHPNKCDI